MREAMAVLHVGGALSAPAQRTAHPSPGEGGNRKMKTNTRYARPDYSRGKRPQPGRAPAMPRRPKLGKHGVRERSSPLPQDYIADWDANVSLLDAIDLLRFEVRTTAHFIYSDTDENGDEDTDEP